MKRFLLPFSVFVLVIACNQKKSTPSLFDLVSADYSGVHFQNTIVENDSINVIDFQYCYNGGGIGVGDFNNDGLKDLFFTGNQVSCRLYLNKGSLQFEDITELAKVTTKSWVTGVSIVDINNDGFDDIYLSVGGANCEGDCPNLLFVNEGVRNAEEIPRFKEMASEYGLAEGEYAQQTVFFDYDLDGDLDAFIARNGNVAFDKNSPFPKHFFPEHLSDVLLENIQPKHLNHPYFVNVSKQAGINEKGFALGLGIADFNNDNLPDIYVGNDFITNDLLYLNNPADSTQFSEQSSQYFKHQTYNSMGLDISDVNNDGYQDLLVLDMLPFTHERRKMMLGMTNYDKYQLALNNSYSPQFVRNTLQMNAGSLNGKPIGFQESAFQAQIAATDWSWAPLFADFDADGDKDLLVTNGYGKDVTDLDFINFSVQNNMFGTEKARDQRIKELLKDRPWVLMPNFFFENQSGASFSDVSSIWSSQPKSISNGAVFADFDNDGDLDIVVNNIDQKAFLLQNNAQLNPDFNYVKIDLEGDAGNRKAIGATIKVWSNELFQTHYQSVIRGYLSSVSPTAFFGLNQNLIDSVEVIWPDGKRTLLKDVTANQAITISHNESPDSKNNPRKNEPLLFEESDDKLQLVHKENFSNDFVYQHLLPTQHSKMGPSLASSEDGKFLFVGGSHGESGQVFEQMPNGKFRSVQLLEHEFEDTAATFFDFDNDGDHDLYVASGGSEHEKNSDLYQDRLYENKEGYFNLKPDKLPKVGASTICIVPFDFDKDGDQDLFMGSNIVPREYPSSPKSVLLTNDGGTFKIAQIFGALGMVNDAVWEDVDNDGWTDLVLARDWMSISILKNEEGKLIENEVHFSNEEGQKLDVSGWWKSLASGDFDNDGDMDFIAGNLGTNSFISPSQLYPLFVYRKDYDQNGSIDPVIGAYQNTKEGKRLMPLHSRDDVTKQLVSLKNRYLSYEDFSKVDFETLLQIDDLEEFTLHVAQSQSVMLENKGDMRFVVKPLPESCQIAQLNTILVDDFDGDGNLDALLAGNDFQAEPQFGRFDALNGIFLKGDGNGSFEALSPAETGFYVPGQTNQLIKTKSTSGQTSVLAGQNNDSLKVFTVKNQ